MANTTQTTQSLRETLFTTIAGVLDESFTCKQGQTVANLATTVCKTADLELRFAAGQGKGIDAAPVMLTGPTTTTDESVISDQSKTDADKEADELAEIFEQGAEACRLGRSYNDNGYLKGTSAWYAWLNGFDAEMEKDDEK